MQPKTFLAALILFVSATTAPLAQAELYFVGDFEAEGIISLDRNVPDGSDYYNSSGNPPTVVMAEDGVAPRFGAPQPALLVKSR